jgi:hypothetical protein
MYVYMYMYMQCVRLTEATDVDLDAPLCPGQR